jgi:hypothetical protein
MTGRTHHLVANDLTVGAPVLGSPALHLRMNFAVPNLMSAAMFSRRVGEIESKHSTETMGPFWDEILAHATACIFLTVAGLESYANELFADAEHTIPNQAKAVTDKAWEDCERKPLAVKFNLVLRLRGKATLKSAAEPLEGVQTLVCFRNALVHFKPEWDDRQDKHKQLSATLQGRFDSSPYLKGDPGLFPRAWASHSCTTWAISTARYFIEGFEMRAGLTYKSAVISHRLLP